MCGLADKAIFHAELHVGQAIGAGARSARGIDRVVGWHHGPEGQNGMELDSGDRPPVKLKGGACRVQLRRGAIDCAEDVGFIMAQVNRSRIVGLEGWAGLRLYSSRSKQHQEQQKRVWSAACHGGFRVSQGLILRNEWIAWFG